MDNKELVDSLVNRRILRSPEIINAFRRVDRINFVLPEYRRFAYIDAPLPIYANQTISQPTTVAMMLEWLKPACGEKILDVGSGSGWTSALLGEIVGPSGLVIGIERHPELVKFGRDNVSKIGLKQVRIKSATDDELGYSKEAPYRRILVSAAADELPESLIKQLDDPGRMVVPIRSSVWVIDVINGKLTKQEFFGFSFVPLIQNS